MSRRPRLPPFSAGPFSGSPAPLLSGRTYLEDKGSLGSSSLVSFELKPGRPQAGARSGDRGEES